MGQLRSILLAGVCAGLAGPAWAQEVPCPCQDVYGNGAISSGAASGAAGSLPDSLANPSPKRRNQIDPYSIYGYEDGAFSLKPTLTIGAVASDNVMLSATNRQADIGYELKPALSFATEWPVHQWTGNVSADWTSFLSHPDAGGLTGSADTNFRLDIRHDTYADFSANVSLTQANPGQSEVPGNATEARRDWAFGASADINHDFGGWQGMAKLAVNRQAYGDVALSGGGTYVNSDLNYVQPDLALRATYGSPHAALRPYVELDVDSRFHDQSVDRNGLQRNSQGIAALAGMTFEPSAIWKGDIAVTGMLRHYNDPSLPVALNGGLQGSLTWSPTQLWSIAATTGTSLNESSLPGIAALPEWTATLNATYALRDNLNLRAGANFTLAGNGNGFDQTTVASIGADYLFNPHFGVSGTLQSTWFNSSSSTSYDEQRAMVSLVMRP